MSFSENHLSADFLNHLLLHLLTSNYQRNLKRWWKIHRFQPSWRLENPENVYNIDILRVRAGINPYSTFVALQFFLQIVPLRSFFVFFLKTHRALFNNNWWILSNSKEYQINYKLNCEKKENRLFAPQFFGQTNFTLLEQKLTFG